MDYSFDLFEQPFLNWRTIPGEPVRVGLRKLLADSATLSPFSDHGPQTTFAVIRVLLVLMHQTRPSCNDGEWQKLWSANRFPRDWLAEIEKSAAGKFDLFHPKRPCFQRISSTDADAKDKPASYLQSHFAAGTGINFASHTYDDQVALCPACCGRGLLELPAFCGAGGSGLMASINSTPPVYFLPVGTTLFHTLLLNWPLVERVPGDHPQWEPGKSPKQIGILEGFTWEPRTVRLLPVPADGHACTNCGSPSSLVVRRMIFGRGVPASKERLTAWRDPHVCYDDIAVGKKTQTRSLTPPEPDKRPAAALGFWRKEVAALLRASTDGEVRCGAVAQARTKAAIAGHELTISCVVPFTRPGQDKKHIIRGDLWKLPLLDAGQVERLRHELTWIEEALAKWTVRTDAEEHPLPGLVLSEFERRAEGHFRELLAREIAPAKWREAVRAAASELTQPESSPGRALGVARVRRAIDNAIDKFFPVHPPKEVTT